MNTITQNTWLRVFNALTLLALGAAVMVGVGFPVVGALTGGALRANLAFALIVISALVALAVLSSYGGSLRIQHVARAAWLTVAVVCLVFAQYVLSLDYPDAHKSADTVMLIAMFVLTFPAGCIAIGLTFVYSSLLLPDRGMNALDLVILWYAFFMIGYLQWFKLTPYFIAKLCARKKK